MGTNTIGRLYISIHALLAESDAAELTTSFFDLNFYPRSPCGERPKFLMMLQSSIKFLSTLSLRRATPRLSSPLWGQENFYPRSPCGERRSKKFKSCCNLEISIHALLAESDCAGPYTPVPISIFLSTLSLRRATRRSSFSLLSLLNFYPRSPCGERLSNVFNCSSVIGYFYPRSPCGERLYHNNTRLSNHTFLSTLSLRRATILLGKTVIRILDNFYPRSPCGERPSQKSEIFGMLSISIHALLAESDGRVLQDITPAGISIHALLAESDFHHNLHNILLYAFLSTLSLRRATDIS